MQPLPNQDSSIQQASQPGAVTPRVLVLDHQRQPLMPCSVARARLLLASGRAAILRRYPLVIILKKVVTGAATQPVRLSVDPGSNTTGIALMATTGLGERVVWAAHLQHRSLLVMRLLARRRAYRSHRRSRKTRYREARHLNRAKPAGWLMPSARNLLDRNMCWVHRLGRWAPVTHLSIELPKFDTQKLANPQITGTGYQSGQLSETNKRAFLVDFWNGKCAYCNEKAPKMELDHVVPRSRGGSHRLGNLVLACPVCNVAKGSQTAQEFGYPHLQNTNLRGAGITNTIRWHLWRRLNSLGIPLETSVGVVTKRNRTRMGFPKLHWIDAACLGDRTVRLNPDMSYWCIKAHRRHARQLVRHNKHGLPVSKPKARPTKHSFLTGDVVRGVVKKGKHKGVHVGRIVAGANGQLSIAGKRIWHRYCQLLQKTDGYDCHLENDFSTSSMSRRPAETDQTQPPVAQAADGATFGGASQHTQGCFSSP